MFDALMDPLLVSYLALVLVVDENSRILVDLTEEGLLSISTADVIVFGLTKIVLLCGNKNFLNKILLAILFKNEFNFYAPYL